MASGETVFHHDDAIHITNKSVMTRSTTYVTAHITSVTVTAIPSDHIWSSALFILGSIVALVGIGLIVGTWQGVDPVGMVILGIGVVVIMLGASFWKVARNRFSQKFAVLVGKLM